MTISEKEEKTIYNGADDNGSGSTTILELAQAFAEAKKQGVGPRRSVLVLWVTGEGKRFVRVGILFGISCFPVRKYGGRCECGYGWSSS